MSSDDSVETTAPVTSSAELFTGRVKWFNNKSGYGFINVTDGSCAGSDIFVHHSAVQVTNQQYKYLVQGEYVEFKLIATEGGAHAVQAAEVGGIKGGKLMCETRREFRIVRSSYKSSSEKEDVSDEVRIPRSVRVPKDDEAKTPRVRGSGPRDGGEWQVVKPGREKSSNGGRGRGRPPRSTGSDVEAKKE
jgi:CspA family cold shock protein